MVALNAHNTQSVVNFARYIIGSFISIPDYLDDEKANEVDAVPSSQTQQQENCIHAFTRHHNLLKNRTSPLDVKGANISLHDARCGLSA